MTHLNEEILIRFLDDDLPRNEKITVEKHLKECSLCSAEKEKLFQEYFAEKPIDRLMKKYAATISSTRKKTADCLDDNTICEYVDDVLSSEKRSAVEKHLANCNYCLHEASELKKIVDKKEVIIEKYHYVRVCENCSMINDHSEKYCAYCGKILKDYQPICCVYCGGEIRMESVYCPHCSKKIVGALQNEIKNEVVDKFLEDISNNRNVKDRVSHAINYTYQELVRRKTTNES